MLNYVAKGIKVTDGIKVANQLILKYRDYPRLSMWPNAMNNGPSK
jgi:hypothetical protein